MENYRVERLSEQNILHLISLYKEVFSVRISEEYLRKKYDTAKFGTSHIGYLGYSSDGLPVAFYGVIPTMVQIERQKMLAAQSADTMTHPDHQRRGLFIQLAQKTYELAKMEGIQFVFGFPNDASLPGFNKLGWRFLPDQLQLFTMSTGGPFQKIVYRLMAPSQASTILSRLETPVEKLFENDSLSGVIHDEKFVEYKRYSKTWSVDIKGTRLWFKVDGSLKVGLAVPARNQDARDFLRLIKKLAAQLHCTKIFFITSNSSTLYRFLCTALHPVDAFPVGFYDLSGTHCDFDKMSFEYADIDSF